MTAAQQQALMQFGLAGAVVSATFDADYEFLTDLSAAIAGLLRRAGETEVAASFEADVAERRARAERERLEGAN